MLRDLKKMSKHFPFDLAGSLFGVLFGNTVKIALGPVGLVLPVDKLVAWTTRMMYEAWQDHTGALYELQPTTSGLLVAKRAPIFSGRLPLVLPEAGTYSLGELLAPGPQLIPPTELRRIDGASVFQSLSTMEENERMTRIKAGAAFTLVNRNLPPAFRK